MSFIQNLFTSRDNNSNSATYVGQQDRLWWDPVTNRFYYSDGVTPGGFPIGAGGNVTTDRLINGAYELVLDATGNVTAPGAISAVGNITANYFVGDGSQLASITGANVTGVVGNATHATVADSANSVSGANVSGQVANALVASTVYSSAQPNITSVGILTSVSASGNATAGNLFTAGQVSAAGNVVGNYFIGNGSQLTGINVSTNKIFNGNSYANVAVPNGNVEINANGQSWNFGTDSNLSAPGAISAVGNITANYFLGDGSQLTNLPVGGSNITVQNQGNTLTTAANTINFTGNGVSSTNVGNVVTVTVTASGGSLPSQTGNAGKILSTNGTNPLWTTMPGVFGLVIDGGSAAYVSTDFIIDGGTAA